MENDICGIFVVDYESREKAGAVVKSMKNCPHLIMAGNSGVRTSLVFIVPESMRWWFEAPAENPEVLGAKAIQVFVLDNFAYPEDFKPRLPDNRLEIPPCGSSCSKCPMHDEYNCPGCPATLDYKG